MEEKEINKLFPVFLKLEELRLLIVGAGTIGLEKLNAVLTNSPECRIKIVSTWFSREVHQLAESNRNIRCLEKAFDPDDLNDIDIVIIAVSKRDASEKIAAVVKEKGKLMNVADKPDLCDFYLGSIVTKGNLKIAISTNGKSPTIAKRLKEFLNDSLPDSINDLLNNMQQIRNDLKGNLSEKITQLNEITKSMISGREKK
jgi:siroheme synthase-like protein